METTVVIRDALVRRSMLVVSPLDGDGLARAATAGADAIVLDMARGAAAHRREEARRELGGALGTLAGSGAELLLWTDATGAALDLRACDSNAVCGVLVTAGASDDVVMVDGALGAWETAQGVSAGTVNIEVVLATGAAVHGCAALAGASARVVALALDEAITGGEAGRRDLLAYYRGALVVAARALGAQAHGSAAPGAGALAAGYAAVGRRLGLRGALCFDADVVSLVNAGFSPGEAEIEAAQRVLSAMEEAVADGRGAIAASSGTMADLANVRQARAVVGRAEAIRRKIEGPAAADADEGQEPSTEEGSAPTWR
jgi:citrate lyase subunit beta/citryl-CoA lyase